MKKLFFTILLTSTICSINAQIFNNDNWNLKSPSKEFMFFETHWDYARTQPGNDDNDDKDIHYAVEVGIRSNAGPRTFGFEAKVAFEEFPNLLGGFEAYGAGFGLYWVAGGNEQLMYYAGFRGQRVYRRNLSTRERGREHNMGLELKWIYTFEETCYVGFRFNWDTNNDVKLIDKDLGVSNRKTVNFVLGFNIGRIGAYRKNQKR